MQIWPLPFIPVFQVHKTNSRILALTGETKTSYRKYGFYRFFLVNQEMLLNLFNHFQGALLRGTCRQDDLVKQNALIFIR